MDLTPHPTNQVFGRFHAVRYHRLASGRIVMRALLGVLLISTLATAQAGSSASNSSSDKAKVPDTLTIPAGSQIPLALKQAISDRKSTRLNSSHVEISYAVFCLKKK